MSMTEREKALIDRFVTEEDHMSDCPYKDRPIPIYEAPCRCVQVFWMRIGAASVKGKAIQIIKQCEERDGTLHKIAEAINDIV